MSTQLPIRSDTFQLEERSIQFFRRHLPHAWICEKPQQDYGVDLRVEVVQDNQVMGHELLVQLKASARAAQGETVVVRLAVSTYNHLWEKLQVAMLVKYVEAEQEAYWLFFKDIPKPPQDQSTFTVRIPRVNALSRVDWSIIRTHLQHVHRRKLGTMR